MLSNLLTPVLLAIATAGAETPPSVDEPLVNEARSWRDAAVVIGVEGYEFLPPAPYAWGDASQFQAFFKDTRRLSSRRITVIADADAETLDKELSRGIRRSRSRGTLWIYFAGHGAVGPDGDWLLLPADADPEDLGATGIPLTELYDMADGSRAREVVIFLDAGFSDSTRDDYGLPGSRGTLTLPEPPEKVALWTASRPGRPALVYHAANHGLFSWAALGALQGWADGALGDDLDGQVSLAEAQAFVDWTFRQLGRTQRPVALQADGLGELMVSQGELRPPPEDALMAALALDDRNWRIADAEERLRAQAADEWTALVERVGAGDPEAEAALNDYIERFEDPTLRIEWTVILPEVQQALQLQASGLSGLVAAAEGVEGVEGGEGGEGTEEPPTEEPPPEEPPPEEPPPANDAVADADVPEEVFDDSCDDLVALEPQALLGELRDGQMACLETRIADAEAQTEMDRVSRVLLANAERKGDSAALEYLLKRHLDEISRADPDLCFRYALILKGHGVESGDEAIYWADMALENKTVWKGTTYKSRVFQLYQLKAETATALWSDAESRFQRDRSDELAGEAEERRADAKVLAREWLDYARASGQEADRALSLCKSAAGTRSYCEGDD